MDNHLVRTLAVGDIHGCLTSLTTLMDAVQLKKSDRLILLGDYIDRGPDSKGVIEWILKTRKSMEIITLRGNHEEMMIKARFDESVAESWNSFGGDAALRSYGTSLEEDWMKAISVVHWRFVETLPAVFETATHIFVHGSIDGERAISEQNEYELVWGRKWGITKHLSGKEVICGHTPEDDGKIGMYSWGACVDTGCYRGDWLSCLDVNTGVFWQANESGQRRIGRV